MTDICEVREVTEAMLRLWKVKSSLTQKGISMTWQKAGRAPVCVTEQCIKLYTLWKTVQGKIKASIRERKKVLQWNCRNFKDLLDTHHEPKGWQNP